MQQRAFLGHAAQQQNGLAYNELGDAASIGVRGVEHRNAAHEGCVEVDLVSAYAEAAHCLQFFGGGKHAFCKLSARAQTNEMHVFDLLDQLVFAQRGLEVLDVLVAFVFERFNGTFVNGLEEEKFDFALIERS